MEASSLYAIMQELVKRCKKSANLWKIYSNYYKIRNKNYDFIVICKYFILHKKLFYLLN